MKRFAVGFMDYGNNDLQIVVIDATHWKYAVMAHPNYPYCQQQLPPGEDGESFTPISELIARYPDLSEEEAVKQCCFDCDCLMGWIELDEVDAFGQCKTIGHAPLTAPPTTLQ